MRKKKSIADLCEDCGLDMYEEGDEMELLRWLSRVMSWLGELTDN